MMVSVCVLTYNHANYIRQTLDSILAQDLKDGMEVLIHDDASTDGTADIIREYEAKYPDIIKPLYETENQFSRSEIKNISGIYNFPRAQGKYIAMCEGDDYWTDPRKLTRQVRYMEKNPGCTMCFHSAIQINSDVVSKKQMRPYRKSQRITPAEIIDKKSGYPTASLLLRADLMKALPDFYMQAPIGDIPMQLTMAAAGYAYYIDEPMCAYRYNAPGSWTRDMYSSPDFKEKQLDYRDRMLRMYDQYNEFTKHKYSGNIQRAKERIIYGTALNIRDYDTIYDLWYVSFYHELSLTDRAYLWTQRLLKKQ